MQVCPGGGMFAWLPVKRGMLFALIMFLPSGRHIIFAKPRWNEIKMNELAPSPSQQDLPSHGLVSLWEMLRFRARAFYDSAKYLTNVKATIKLLPHNQNEAIVEKTRADLRRELEKFSAGTMMLQADSSHLHCLRIIEQLESPTVTYGEILQPLEELANRFQDDLLPKSLFVLKREDQDLFDNGVSLIGESVAAAFPSTIPDIEEAGKCLALDRPTAAVFHLMRALEVPLKLLAEKLSPNDPKPNWDPILRESLNRSVSNGQVASCGSIPMFFAAAASE